MMTLDMISTSITNSITSASDTTDEEKEVIEYGVYLALSEIGKLIVILLISIPLGYIKPVLFIIVTLGIMRNFLGGVHAQTQIGCFLTYCFLLFSVILLSSALDPDLIKIIMLASIPFVYYAIFKYAPADVENKPVLSKKQRKFFRRAGTITVSCFYLLSLVLPALYSGLLVFTVIWEAFSLLPIIYKITKNKYGYERGK